MNQDRRHFLRCAAATAAVSATTLPAGHAWAQPSEQRRFAPEPGDWRTFDVTTRVDIAFPEGQTQVWLPVPSIESDWQRSLTSSFQTNGAARFVEDGLYGLRMLHVSFEKSGATPFVELTSRVQTRNRKADLARRGDVPAADAATLRFWTRPTRLLPTDGIVRETALTATKGARTDREKVRAIYDWVVANTYREPKVRGCGEGDIKTMLETGNLGGKCADLNAIFVGLCRAAGVPARDVYGLRLAPSAFGYKELNSSIANGAR